MNPEETKFNFFYFKEGEKFKKRLCPIQFFEFKKNFMQIAGYCQKEEDLDNDKLILIYNSYISVFLSGDFPIYKKSKLHQVLLFCNINSNLKFYLDRGFKYESAARELNERQNTVSLDSFIKRFGQEEGEKRYNSYVDKWKKTIGKHDKKLLYKNWKNSPENYLKKINPNTGIFFSVEEAEIKIKEDLSKGFKKVWKEYREGKREKNMVNTTLEYFKAKGFTTEEANLALKQRQATFTLEKCIQRYGLVEGTERFKERNDKWQKTLNSKTDDEKKSIMLSKTRRLGKYSKESLIFFQTLINNKDLDFLKNYKVFLGDNEMVLWDPNYLRPYFYDFSIPALKTIIEYNGSVFHPDINKLNEKEFLSWKCPLSKLTGPEKYKKDQQKEDFARRLGYDLLIVWDHEDHKKKLKECTDLIKRKHYEQRTNN